MPDFIGISVFLHLHRGAFQGKRIAAETPGALPQADMLWPVGPNRSVSVGFQEFVGLCGLPHFPTLSFSQYGTVELLMYSLRGIIQILVAARVAWLLRANRLFFECGQNRLLDLIPAGRIDRVGNVREHPTSSPRMIGLRSGRQGSAAVGTVPCSHFVLRRTSTALLCQFAAGHGDKMSALPLNNLQVPHDKRCVQRNGAKCT